MIARRILIADPCRITALQLLEMLQILPNYEILHAQSSEEALRLIHSHPPDCVLVEKNLLEDPSANLIAHLGPQHPKRYLPFIVLSKDQDAFSMMRTIAKGAEGYLIKPFSQASIHHKLSEILPLA